MIIMKMELENVLCFKHNTINFSYPKKINNSLIGNEHLKEVPSFRYKKLNILIGSNASGKTSLIKCIWKTLLFLKRKEIKTLDGLGNKGKISRITVDLIPDYNDEIQLHRYKIIYNPDKEEDCKVSHTYVAVSKLVSKKETYEKCASRLDKEKDNYKDYRETLNNVNNIAGSNLVLPATENYFDAIRFAIPNNVKETKDYLYILKNVLKTLDPSIKDVVCSKDSNNAYVFKHEGMENIIIQDNMKFSDIDKLSSGTKYGIGISNIIYSIKHHLNGIYLIDEQFSYVNSDIEKSIISTMVSMLGENEQLFITTHNENILSLSFPFHSFYFLKKDNYGDSSIRVSCGSEIENRSNVSPKTIVDNDLFGTAPDVNKIFELGEIDE